MTRLGVDFQALHAASAQIATAADAFGQGSRQAGGIPRAAGATGEATILLERALDAMAGALRKAAAELQQVSSHLGATADTYARTEHALAAWKVPGGGG
jgi:hypothetical protein